MVNSENGYLHSHYKTTGITVADTLQMSTFVFLITTILELICIKHDYRGSMQCVMCQQIQAAGHYASVKTVWMGFKGDWGTKVKDGGVEMNN